MASLKSVKNVPGIDFYEHRDNLYYNKYQYRARFRLEGVRYTWYNKTPEDLEKRLYKNKPAYYGVRDEDRPIVIDNLETLKNFITWRNERKTDKKASIRVEFNTVAVFSSDLTLLKTLENLGPDLVIDYTEAQTSNYVGVKTFAKEPKHKYRVYLKSKIVQNNLINDLKELIDRSPNLYPCPSLDYWLQVGANQNTTYSWRFRYTSSTHFIDYDDESTLSYLALMHGDYLGKRYKLEKRPDPV